MIGVCSYSCMLWKRNGIRINYTLSPAPQVEELSPILLDLECDISRDLFPHLWSSSSCDAIPTFKIFDQIDLENTEKVINRISYFKKILPILYMLKKC